MVHPPKKFTIAISFRNQIKKQGIMSLLYILMPPLCEQSSLLGPAGHFSGHDHGHYSDRTAAINEMKVNPFQEKNCIVK
jgi:hypothetical protein